MTSALLVILTILASLLLLLGIVKISLSLSDRKATSANRTFAESWQGNVDGYETERDRAGDNGLSD